MATLGGVPGGASALVAIGVKAGKAIASAVQPVAQALPSAQQLPFGGLENLMSSLLTAGQWVGAALVSAGVALGIARRNRR